MTEERAKDEVVSATYRQLPGERSPANLDDAVLRMAASHAQHANYSRSMSWTRPLAWAASIALCLAITLEVIRLPAPEVHVVPGAAGGRTLADTLPAEADTDMPAAASPAPASALLLQKQEAAESRDEGFSDTKDAAGPARSKRANDLAAPATVFELPTTESEQLRQAEELARLQNGSNNESATQESALRAFASKRATGPCPDEARARPDSWLKCIEALEEMGVSEIAALERKSLLEAFPDFKLP